MCSSDLKELTRDERHNQLIDINWAILSGNMKTTRNMLVPGGFETLKSVKKKMDLLRSNNSENLVLSLPSTQLFFHTQNAIASKLIGIFANHNVANAVLQRHDVKINPNVFKFSLDGEYFNKLSNNSPHVSRNMAEMIAASVDAVKDPVFSSLNIDINTANVAATLLRVG